MSESNTTTTPQNKPTTTSTQQPFLVQYWKPLAGVVVLIIFVAGAFGFMSMNKTNKEMSAQDELFKLETDYKKHVQASEPNPMEPAAKDTTKVDVEKLKADLNSFSVKNKGLVASQIAALYYSDLLVRENKKKEALDFLLASKSAPKNLTSILMIKKIGQLYADLGQCNDANSNWETLLKTSSAKYIHSEVKMSQSLCLMNSGDLPGAEKILMTLKSDALRLEAISKDPKKMSAANEELQNEIRKSQMTKIEVEKILRLIQYKSKSSPSSSSVKPNINQSGS